ncbi:hypothetical protein NDU88_003180 [Pleurodeles waltl]|uniref:Uncharacterized protein n=1 Tax=Pleurodeles waltl TaxID=8319 RepID=A0AAV7W4K1_PLEWA|nr:hypothetical protein NDU88_003180 [Pleurodeles waltl]
MMALLGICMSTHFFCASHRENARADGIAHHSLDQALGLHKARQEIGKLQADVGGQEHRCHGDTRGTSTAWELRPPRCREAL